MPALPDPDTAVALPVDRRAIVLLQRLDNSTYQGRDNIIGGEVSRYWTGFGQSPRVGERQYRQGMSEAFDWRGPRAHRAGRYAERS